MIGTTQFTNAVIERRELAPTAIIRIALPAGELVPQMIDWFTTSALPWIISSPNLT